MLTLFLERFTTLTHVLFRFCYYHPSMKTIISYLRVLAALAVTVFVSHYHEVITDFFDKSSEPELLAVFFLIALLFMLSFSVFYLSAGTGLPSFVLALFFGMATQPLLAPITHERTVLGVLVSIGAMFILFGGGLETPFKNFRKLFWKILSLSFVGFFLTALFLSSAIYLLNELLGTNVSLVTAILLGAILASTDPAAIIPVLKQLRFRNRDTKDIVVSESAVTDVTGTLLTIIFLTLLVGGLRMESVGQGYAAVFQGTAVITLLKEVFFGVFFGVVGYGLLEMLKRFKNRHSEEFESDAAYFFFVPIVIYVITIAFGGSGFLAAFISGLLFMLREQLHQTEHFFNYTVDGFLKPVIFLMLGALINFDQMIEYAGIGIAAALIFMFVIRPIAVFVSLGPFALFKRGLSFREMVFVSFVRETGAIPAVLLITVISVGLPGMQGFIAIGMWVILCTLIIQPPLTPYVARWLNVAVDIKDEHDPSLPPEGTPFVILGSRGGSFVERLPIVIDWADTHHVRDIVLLHCLEDDYSEELVENIGSKAQEAFDTFNKERREKDEAPIRFWYISRKGFLQDNIDKIAKENTDVALIFVGRKVLDFHLSEIKQLSVPLYFMD